MCFIFGGINYIGHRGVLLGFEVDLLVSLGQLVGFGGVLVQRVGGVGAHHHLVLLLGKRLEVVLFILDLVPAQINRDKIESNLSVPGVQGCHENALIKSFKMSPHLICLQASFKILVVL